MFAVESFKTIIRSATADALPDRDFTAKLLLDGLPAGQDIFYRVRFDDISESGIEGETQVGHFRTAPTARSIGVVRLVGRYPRAKAGASTKRAAGCGLTAPCSTTVRTSSSIPATTSMPIARWSGN